jgi:hypothetical protein
VVRGAAVWALSRLSKDRWQTLRDAHALSETDPSVIDEWRAA